MTRCAFSRWRWPGWMLGVALMFAAGCAHRIEPSSDVLAGRLALRIDGQPERSLSAGFDLSGDATQGRLALTGPLGTTAAQAEWAPGRAWLVTDQGRNGYPDLDALAAAALGEPIPIAALFDWLRGRPWAGAPSASRTDGVVGFDQMGWRIDLSRWSDGWLEARRDAPPAVTVRARLEPR